MFKILILEDEEILGKLYTKNLEKNGHIVKWCKTVKEAKEIIKTFKADISLIDHGIKNDASSGIDFIPELRKKIPNQKIFILSNYSDSVFKKKALENGADDYLIKLNTSPKEINSILLKFISKT